MNHTRGEIVGKMLEMGSSRKSILEDVFLRSVGIGPEERSIHSFRDLVDAFREEEVDPVDSLYSPKPAIRIIKHSYHRHDDRDYEFLCDKSTSIKTNICPVVTDAISSAIRSPD